MGMLGEEGGGRELGSEKGAYVCEGVRGID